MPQVTFDNWAGGEFGDLGPTGAKDNQWTGRNMMVYTDGTRDVFSRRKDISCAAEASAEHRAVQS